MGGILYFAEKSFWQGLFRDARSYSVGVVLAAGGAWCAEHAGWIPPWLSGALATILHFQYTSEILLGSSVLCLLTALLLLRRSCDIINRSADGTGTGLQSSTAFKTALKNFICYNQGELAQYSFLVAERHKKLKDAKNSTPEDHDALREKLDELNDFHEHRFVRIMKKNHELIQKFWASTNPGSRPPRVVLKWCKEDKIGDLYRHDPLYYCEEPIHRNSGAKYVSSTGCWYMCNDIAGKIAQNKYTNTRIDTEKVKKLVQECGGDAIPHEKWMECWLPLVSEEDNEQIRVPEDACYRSTMLIPLTLLNNENLNEDFRRHFDIPIHPKKKHAVGRAIYGILCFDSTEPNFFDRDIHVDLGYVFADIISLYLVSAATYTQYSKTFQDVVRILKQSSPAGTTQEFV